MKDLASSDWRHRFHAHQLGNVIAQFGDIQSGTLSTPAMSLHRRMRTSCMVPLHLSSVELTAIMHDY